MRETDLYQPIKAYLEAHDYAVQAEVKHCDIVARKGDQLVVVELKTSINLTLLVQATRRQSITDAVYVAVPATGNPRNRHWRGVMDILKRLQLGLLTVSESPLGLRVTKLFDPVPADRLKAKQQAAIIHELQGRSNSYNIGGSHQRKLITAYREHAIFLGCCLRQFGPLTPKQLRHLGGNTKTTSILSDNHYAWFERVRRGVYALTTEGEAGLDEHPQLCEQAMTLIKQQQDTSAAGNHWAPSP